MKEEEVRRHDGASSDGYLAHIFRHAAKELFNEDVGEVTYRTLRCVGLGWPLSVFLCGQCCLSGVNSINRTPALQSQLQVWEGGPIYRIYTSQDRKAFYVLFTDFYKFC